MTGRWGSMRTRAVIGAATALGRRGFEVRRHPAARRQQLMAAHHVDLVLDVGAADGGYARELRSFGYRGDIISFEPRHGGHEALQQSAAADPRWTTRAVALGREAGRAEINLASNETSSSLLPLGAEHVAAAPHVGYVGTEEVEVSTLDVEAAASVAAHRATVLKIDTQGFEREVLAGGGKVLPDIVGLQLELSFTPMYAGGMLIDEALTWAYEHGFTLAVMEQGFASPRGQVLQADGFFVRTAPA